MELWYIYITGLLAMIAFRSATFVPKNKQRMSEHEVLSNITVPIVWPIYVPIALMWYFGKFIRKKYLVDG